MFDIIGMNESKLISNPIQALNQVSSITKKVLIFFDNSGCLLIGTIEYKMVK